eukprot:6609369-Pyramimonas_sp.AAC.1
MWILRATHHERLGHGILELDALVGSTVPRLLQVRLPAMNDLVRRLALPHLQTHTRRYTRAYHQHTRRYTR